MPEYLNQLLADSAMALVRESFTDVSAPWWWERRLGGGIEVCQEFDPETASREISDKTGGEVSEVLTFEISGETESRHAAELLAERSSEPEGLASGLYRRIEEIVRAG
jgi:hypothetical protein